MAHTKSQGAVKGNRDSVSKRLGVKVYGGQKITAGAIIVRQRGSQVWAGDNTSTGRDFTIFATQEGYVHFKQKQGKKFVEVLSKLPAQAQ